MGGCQVVKGSLKGILGPISHILGIIGGSLKGVWGGGIYLYICIQISVYSQSLKWAVYGWLSNYGPFLRP